jgi:glycosyltransferase involved in cell wall biosynthesis
MSDGRPSPLLSVVLPTRDRLESLKLAFDSLARQTLTPGTFEVVVADDGSADKTAEFLAGPPPYPFALRAVRLPGSGPAAARNRAIDLAVAPRILLLGDDTFPEPDALRRHVEAADNREIGIQGRIEWDPAAPTTPVMRFLAPEGPQFYFRGLAHGRPIPYTAQYGANFSAPATWFREDPFDESFPSAAFEDTELAYRWSLKGRTIIYWETAVCRHRHHYGSIDPVLDRQRRAGRAARHAVRLHPAMARDTILWPLAVGGLFAMRYGMRRLRGRAADEDLWDLQCRAAFLAGLLERPRSRPAP